MRFSLSFVFAFVSFWVCSQSLQPIIEQGDTVFTFSERLPVFPGGPVGMYKVLNENLVYPEEAKRQGISGRVYVHFAIDTVGDVFDVHVVEGIHKDLDAEVIRVVSLLNGWEPAMQRGKKVSIEYRIPFTFTAEPPSKADRRRQRKEARKRFRRGIPAKVG